MEAGGGGMVFSTYELWKGGGGIVNVKIPLSSELRKREEGVMVFST